MLEKGERLVQEHYNCPEVRVRTLSVRLIELHTKYCKLIARALAKKAVGNDGEYSELIRDAAKEIGKYEAMFEKYYDHALAFVAWILTLEKITAYGQNVIEADN